MNLQLLYPVWGCGERECGGVVSTSFLSCVTLSRSCKYQMIQALLFTTYKIKLIKIGILPFIRMLAIWGDGRLGIPPNHLWKFCLKGSRKVISVNYWAGGQSGCHPHPHPPTPPCAGLYVGLLTPHNLSLDAILFMKGEAREEIWSSVNYVVFISTSLSNGKGQ